MKKQNIIEKKKLPEITNNFSIATSPLSKEKHSKTLPPNLSKLNLAPEQERLHVAVRVRPLHVVTELGHENIIEVEKDLITVKSDLHHDLKTRYDIVLSNSS
jgi:hypothetical protein